MSLSTLLKNIGISFQEERIFRSLLESGPSLASEIAKTVDLPRNTVRGLLDSLVKKGVVLRLRQKNRFIYQSESAEGIAKMLQRRKEAQIAELEGQLSLLNSCAKELEPRSGNKHKPRIRFFSGLEGLKQLYEDTLSATGEIRSWGSFDENRHSLPTYFQSYYRRRAEKGIPMISIHPNTPLARQHKRRDRAENRRSYLVDSKLFNISPEIQVYDNKLNIVSWEDRIGVLIESKPVADAMNSVFELCRTLLRKQPR